MNGQNTQQGGDLRALMSMIRRRGAIVVLATAIGVVGALVFSNSQAKSYDSTASLLFRTSLLDAQVTGLPLQLPGGDAQREAATNLALVSLDDVRTRAAARLGPGYTPKRLEDEVDISANGKSSIVEVTASESTPEEAARVANAVAASFVAFRRAGLRDQITVAATKVRERLKEKGLPPTARKQLRLNLTRLGLLASVQTGDVQFVQRAEPPTKASSPKPLLNAVIGGVLGLLLGIGIALAFEQMDRRVRRTDELEEALGLPLLAAVPRSKALRQPIDRGIRDAVDDEEPFRRLRASLRHISRGDELRSVLLTSAGAGSGKTTVAMNLAAVAAAGGQARVLLIEADMRRPQLAEMLGVRPDRGLHRMLESDASFNGRPVEDIFSVPVSGTGGNGDGASTNGAGRRLDVLPAGAATDQAGELLDSDRMRDLLDWAYERYDFVVIDGPPPTLVSDAIPLMKLVDGVVVVSRLGRDSDPELRELREEIERFGVTPVGAVATFSRRVSNPYSASKR